jgi:hypothetical protein
MPTYRKLIASCPSASTFDDTPPDASHLPSLSFLPTSTVYSAMSRSGLLHPESAMGPFRFQLPSSPLSRTLLKPSPKRLSYPSKLFPRMQPATHPCATLALSPFLLLSAAPSACQVAPTRFRFASHETSTLRLYSTSKSVADHATIASYMRPMLPWASFLSKVLSELVLSSLRFRRIVTTTSLPVARRQLSFPPIQRAFHGLRSTASCHSRKSFTRNLAGPPKTRPSHWRLFPALDTVHVCRSIRFLYPRPFVVFHTEVLNIPPGTVCPKTHSANQPFKASPEMLGPSTVASLGRCYPPARRGDGW